MENNTYENYNANPEQPVQPQYQEPQYQAPQYQPQYQAAYQPQPDALAGSVLTKGILSVVFACTFIVSFLGIIFGAQGKNLAAQCAAINGGYLPGKARAGKYLSIGGFIGGIVMTALFGIYFLALLSSL